MEHVVTRRVWATTVVGYALITGLLFAGCSAAPETEPTAKLTVTPSADAVVSATPTALFNRTVLSLDDPMSIWVVSNKHRSLNPAEFVPSDLSTVAGVPNEFSQPLREPAARAVEQLYAAAQSQGVNFGIISAYRDYNTQVALYNKYVNRDGQEAADTYSARPGHSEHQTGLAVDFDDGGSCYLTACFESTAAGQWLATHAYEYGFVLRYPAGKEAITGFTYEPWHFRYVGVELATEMHNTGIQTLEEFFGLDAAPSYK
ncbi:D-alanyl-D-alanine carboxypeptidase [Aurantimicrobium minutum]|uniref:M15 family metallopeptidase n=1 Tax=Aurantimicrobium minutum TaxID=708131 RepID=UPI0024758272|nr:M15 family metallopeptidase [Aurantimicrobium minutum]MDH6532166.1 D-alanyl-D-alanine carboxypeptidase [Aurantimicrobium minutum]